MEKKEGYTIVTVPEQKYRSCYECKWYEHKLLVSGQHPRYGSNCKHPDVPMKYGFGNDFCNLNDMFGRVETPEWCPVGEVKKIIIKV